jgi:hypothetical protein
MLNPLLQGIGATFGGQAQAPDTESPQLRSQADELRAKQLQQLSGPTQPPQMGGNGFGLTDVLALLGAAASGRHADKFLGSYLETKQQAQAQKQQAALQQWGEQQQQQMNLANVYGQQATALDKRADQTAQDAIDRTRNTNAFLGQRLNETGRMERAADAEKGKNDRFKAGLDGKFKLADIREQGGLAKVKAQQYATMAKQTPQGRVAWALANKYSPEEARALGESTPQELLTTARRGKIATEVEALKTKTRLDDVRAKQIVEATRYMGPKLAIQQETLANQIRNVDSLISARNAGLQLRKDELDRGRSTLNAALVSTSKMRNTAQTELTKLQKLKSTDPAVLDRMGQLEESIRSSEDLYSSLMGQAKLMPELAPEVQKQAVEQLGNPFGTVPPMAINPNGMVGPINAGGQNPPAPNGGKTRPGKGPKILNIRVVG